MPGQPSGDRGGRRDDDTVSAQPLLFERASERKFRQFHESNPQVYRLLVEYARKAKERGYFSYGIGALWEVVRWDNHLKFALSGVEPKMNNNYRSRYARLIMEREPDLRGFFHLRELKS